MDDGLASNQRDNSSGRSLFRPLIENSHILTVTGAKGRKFYRDLQLQSCCLGRSALLGLVYGSLPQLSHCKIFMQPACMVELLLSAILIESVLA